MSVNLNFEIDHGGLPDALAAAPARIDRALMQSVNRTADRGRTRSARMIREEVAFRPSYLQPSSGNLTVARRANPSNLEAEIKGRQRPTQLSHFAKRLKTAGRVGATVEVAPGVSKRLDDAIVLGLKSGNTGIALRLAPGERIKNKRQMIPLYASYKGRGKRRKASDYNLYLLYGPSVDQVFRSVAERVSPELAEFMQDEFDRLSGVILERSTHGGKRDFRLRQKGVL